MLRVVDCCTDSFGSWFTWFMVISLTQALLPRPLSLDGWPALGRDLLVLNFYLWMMEVAVLIGTFRAADILCNLPQISASKPDFEPQTRPLTSCLVYGVACTVRPYIGSPEPFQIMSNQLDTPQVDANKAQEWSARTGCTWNHLWQSQQRIWIHMYMWFS